LIFSIGHLENLRSYARLLIVDYSFPFKLFNFKKRFDICIRLKTSILRVLDMIKCNPDCVTVRILPDKLESLIKDELLILLLDGRDMVKHNLGRWLPIGLARIRLLVEDHQALYRFRIVLGEVS
jgi:hypothetical protein